MDQAVLIISNNKVNSAFIKANSHLLKKYSSEFDAISDYDSKLKKLQEIWILEFSSNLVLDNNVPVSIEFLDKSRKFLFFLTFGS